MEPEKTESQSLVQKIEAGDRRFKAVRTILLWATLLGVVVSVLFLAQINRELEDQIEDQRRQTAELIAELERQHEEQKAYLRCIAALAGAGQLSDLAALDACALEKRLPQPKQEAPQQAPAQQQPEGPEGEGEAEKKSGEGAEKPSLIDRIIEALRSFFAGIAEAIGWR